MAGRFSFWIVMACCAIWHVPGFGQGYPPPGHGQPIAGPAYPAHPAAYVPPEPGWGPPHCPPPSADAMGPAYCPPGAEWYGAPQPGLMDHGAFHHGPFESALAATVAQSWFRVEYLHWTIQDPGDVMLGAESNVVLDPTVPFPIFDAVTNEFLGTARVPTTRNVSLHDNNGVRATWGLPLTFADLELSTFYLHRARHVERAPELPSSPLPGQGTFLATSLLLFGEPANEFLLYDRFFEVTYTSRFFGAEANMVFDIQGRGQDGLHISPMFGFRYLNVREGMLQVGEFDDLGTQPVLRSVIDSQTWNNIWTPQVGIRTELRHKWFTVGVEPKLGFGVNTWQAEVMTDQLRGFGDPRVRTRERGTNFSPVFELSVFGKIHLTDWFSAFVSFNYLFAHNVTRASDNIFYNEIAGPPAVVVDAKRYDIWTRGLTVGGEIRFR